MRIRLFTSRSTVDLERFSSAFIAAMCLAACASSDADKRNASAEPNPAIRGLAYARENCASCHAVEVGDLVSPNAGAPSFEALAARPDMSRIAMTALLRTPHRNMPALIVEPDRADELTAYLLALGEGE